MDVFAAASTAGASPPNAKPAADSAALSSDFETFLKMLTAQMRNQDPLNPVDSSDYAVQLATFSSVEQQVLTNELLSDLGAGLNGGITELAGWIGMQARAPVDGHFTGTPLDVAFTPELAADRQELVIRDAQGAEVGRSAVPPGQTSIRWGGLGATGQMLPEGPYSFEVESYGGDTLLSTQQAQVYSRVIEARIEDGAPVLVLDSGARVAPETVTALRSG